MDFHQRLEKAIERGHKAGDARARAEVEKALSEKELARLHSQYRLELSERIEACLRQLSEHFPGFRFETIIGEAGWGAAVSRDDIRLKGGSRTNFFSRLEMVIRPINSYHVIDLAAKATIRNKELFNRSHFQRLTEGVDTASFTEMIDLWTLEYAEVYAAKS